jgi:hypothetical protein
MSILLADQKQAEQKQAEQKRCNERSDEELTVGLNLNSRGKTNHWQRENKEQGRLNQDNEQANDQVWQPEAESGTRQARAMFRTKTKAHGKQWYLSVDAGPPDCGTVGEDSRPTTVLPPWGEFDRPDVAQAAGDADSGLSNHTIRPAASTPSAEMVQLPPHGPSATQIGHDHGQSQVPCSSPPVAGQHISAAWCSSRLSPSVATGSDNRCLIPQFEGGMAKESSPGGLVPSVERAAHQCPWTPDCLLDTEALLALSQEQRKEVDVKHLGGVSHQPPRRDQVTGFPEGSPETMDMVSSLVLM